MREAAQRVARLSRHTAVTRFAHRLEPVSFAALVASVALLPLSKTWSQAAYAVALGAWITYWVLGRPPRRDNPLVLPLFVFLLLSALSSTLAPVPGPAWAELKSVALLLMAVLAAEVLRKRQRVRTALLAAIVGCLVSVAFVGWHYARGIGVRLAFPPTHVYAGTGLLSGDVVTSVNGAEVRTPGQLQRAIPPDGRRGMVKLAVRRTELEHPLEVHAPPAILLAGLDGLELRKARPIRARGLVAHPASYAGVLAQVSLVALGFALGLRRRRRIFAAVFALLAVVLFLTATRAAVAAMLAGSLVLAWTALRPRWRYAAATAVVAAALITTVWIARTRGLGWLALHDAGSQYRVLMWKDAARLAIEHPLAGVGMDNAKARWRELDITAFERFELRSHFHSTPLQIAAERGLPALAAWLWVMTVWGKLLWRSLRSTTQPGWMRGAALGLAGAALAFALFSLVHYTLGDALVAMMAWFLAGTSVALDRLVREQAAQSVTSRERLAA